MTASGKPKYSDWQVGLRRRLEVRAALACVLALILMAVAAPAASAAPWPCDNSPYMTQFDATNPAEGTRLFRLVPQPDGTILRDELGAEANTHLNAIGFRPQDGFMYAFDNTNTRLVRIEQNASGEPLFFPIALPPTATITSTVVGVVLGDGNYFVWSGTTGEVYDVTQDPAVLVRTITAVDPTQVPRGDMAIHPVTGQLYSIDLDPGGSTFGVYEFNFIGNTIVRGDRVGDSTSAGGQWFMADGTYMQYNNGGPGPDGNGIYSLDLDTGQLSFRGSGPAFSNADGTSCANTIFVSKDAEPRTVVAGEEVVYTYEITSAGLTDNEIEFVDQLPAGLTYVPGGVTLDPSFGTTNAYDGTNTLEITGVVEQNTTVTVTARVRVAPDAGCDVDLQNQASATVSPSGLPPVTVESDDPDTSLLGDPTTIHVICESDLSLLKTGTRAVTPGGQVSWTITATNNGPSVSAGATITDAIPGGVTNATTSTPGCTIAGGQLTCQVGVLAVGQSTQVTVTGDAPTSKACFSNVASVAGQHVDPNPINDRATWQTCTLVSRFEITKTANGQRVMLGNPLTYTILVRNTGPDPSTSTTVLDRVPSHLDVRSVAASKGQCAMAGNRVTCELGAMAVGEQATVTVNTVAVRAGGAKNVASVTDPQCETQPCVTGEEETEVTKPKLQLGKTVTPPRLRAGDTATFRIRVRNPSRATLDNVRVCDRLPQGLVLVRSSRRMRLVKGAYCYTYRRLPALSTRTIVMRVRALRGTSGRKTNRATATSPDARGAQARRSVRVLGGAVLGAGGVTG